MITNIKAVCFDFNGVIEESSVFFGSRLNKELLAWLPRLKKQGYKIGILSNNYAKLNEPALFETADVILTSSEIGSAKPDKEAFTALFGELNVLPQEAIFIDDSPRCLANANKIGYHPILFIDNETLKKELQNFGILL